MVDGNGAVVADGCSCLVFVEDVSHGPVHVVGDAADVDVQLREVASGRILATLDSGRDPIIILNLKFAPESNDLLYLACCPSGIRIWDLAGVQRTLRDLGLEW